MLVCPVRTAKKNILTRDTARKVGGRSRLLQEIAGQRIGFGIAVLTPRAIAGSRNASVMIGAEREARDDVQRRAGHPMDSSHWPENRRDGAINALDLPRRE
jgi:hypothetical protein